MNDHENPEMGPPVEEKDAEQAPSIEGEHLDEKWFDRFEEITVEPYAMLDGDAEYRKSQYEAFVAGDMDAPELDHPKLEGYDFDKHEKKLLQLKADILEEEDNEVVAQTYRWRLNEELAKLRMLRATSEGDDRRFKRYTEFVYGKPDEDIHAYTLGRLRSVVEDHLSDEDEESRAAAQRLYDELYKDKDIPESSINFDTFDIPEKVDTSNESPLSYEEIKQAFADGLERNAMEGWSVLADETGSLPNFRVLNKERQVGIPSEETLMSGRVKPFTESMIEAKVRHEVETHALRNFKGERSKLRLLRLGLDRYTSGEEGVATMREQELLGTDDFSGFLGHFATSLAIGVDGKPRNFRDTFSILRDYKRMKVKQTGEAAGELANTFAWKRSVRTFRGSTGETPGVCFTKDIAYREGNIGVWRLKNEDADEVRRFSVGKYDPTNPRHVWILDQLGISEEDLDELEQEQT